MRFAYADPPYLGRCSYYGHEHNETGTRPFDGGCWNDIDTHRCLIDWLASEYPDGWAMSATAPSTFALATLLPPGVRLGVWVKPFASYKPGINPGYCWEAVFWNGGRKRGRDADTVRDFISANILLEKGFTGAKPPPVCNWILDLLGFDPSDIIDDIFVGSGAFTDAVCARIALARGLNL